MAIIHKDMEHHDHQAEKHSLRQYAPWKQDKMCHNASPHRYCRESRRYVQLATMTLLQSVYAADRFNKLEHLHDAVLRAQQALEQHCPLERVQQFIAEIEAAKELL